MKFRRRNHDLPNVADPGSLVEVQLLADQVLDAAQKMREAVALLRSQDTIANPDHGGTDA
jgi:hypothetical protein